MPAKQDDEGLFQMTPVEPLVAECGPVDKTFRRFQPDQLMLVPSSLDEWLPQEHLARFIADLVDEHLDLSRSSAAGMRSAKVVANAFRAGFHPGTCRGSTPTTARVGGGPPFDPGLSG